MATLLTDQGTSELADARVTGDELWIRVTDLVELTGWTVEPQGLCRGDSCVPLPEGWERHMRDDLLDVAGLWRLLERVVISASDVWLLGDSAAERRDALASLQAPDFTLPDLDGNLHSLSEHRGKKVLLASWASW